LIASAIVSATFAQPAHDFVTVGSPGNRPTNPAEVPMWPSLPVGAVNYEYRITRTEVLVEHWLPFVRAYAPYWQGSSADSRFTSNFVLSDNAGGYFAPPGTERYPVDVSWHTAARYVNWLHNGSILGEQWAFESGVYDTSTFTMNPDGSWNDQPTHSPDARFWIPTSDETFKAFYHDPHRYGQGEEGYWLYPNASNLPSISGPPGVGTTNAGLGTFSPHSSAGQYPQVATPWGLLDASGGEDEFTETVDYFGFKYVFGTSLATSSEFIQFVDRTDWSRVGTSPNTGLAGFRIAAPVPQPGAGVLVVVSAGVLAMRRRRAG